MPSIVYNEFQYNKCCYLQSVWCLSLPWSVVWFMVKKVKEPTIIENSCYQHSKRASMKLYAVFEDDPLSCDYHIVNSLKLCIWHLTIYHIHTVQFQWLNTCTFCLNSGGILSLLAVNFNLDYPYHPQSRVANQIDRNGGNNDFQS